MSIEPGKYRRTGIFLEEIDDSQVNTPVIQGVQTLVIGSSKKGRFNAPVRLTTQQDLEAVYGPLDRSLEKKGSFFHRTVSKMLESSPVLALNLLLTDDELDTLEYVSMSTASNVKNDIKRTGPYRRFFDTTGYWKRDTESFHNLVKNNPDSNLRAMNFTNMSDKNITVFIFKSKKAGYDISMLNWFGTIEKIPTYVYVTDYVSDYMVDILVVAGDWSDYQTLAVDSKWSKYFNKTGLIKDQIDNFANDKNVTTLKYYRGLSILPYFRDKNGQNIFVENVVNLDTDFTGLFCSFDISGVETDKPNGLLDLVGNNLATMEVSDIEFFSYKDSIIEDLYFANKELDTPGNVISFGSMYKITTGDRSANYAEGYVKDVHVNYTDTVVGNPTSTTIHVVLTNAAYCVNGGQLLPITQRPTGSNITVNFTINAADYAANLYTAALVIDSTGTIRTVIGDSTRVSSAGRVAVAPTDIVLGYLDFTVALVSSVKNFTELTYTPVTMNVNADGFRELTVGAGDFTVSNSSGSLTYTFLGTSNPSTKNYVEYRRLKMFNILLSNLHGPNKDKMALLTSTASAYGKEKVSLSTMTISNIVATTTSNKSFTLNTGLTNSQLTDLIAGNLALYIKDDEFKMDTHGFRTTGPATVGSENYGVVGKYSDFYIKYFNGEINADDYFYENILPEAADVEYYVDGNDDNFIIFQFTSITSFSIPTNTKIKVPGSVSNKVVTVIDSSNYGVSANSEFKFKVNENITPEIVTEQTVAYDLTDASKKQYLKAYLDNSKNLFVRFADSSLIGTALSTDLAYNKNIDVISQKSNFKQSIEIEIPANYVQVPNKILVDAARYSELKVGDYLEAYVDETLLEVGEVPKRLTRVMSKKAYSGDPSLAEITCDARIAKINMEGGSGEDLQTFRFTTIEDYVNTYKALTFKGFKVRQDSLPDGTEERQSKILDLIGKGTHLFNALVNKDATNNTFRYLIDSYGNGLTENSKHQLVDICGERLDVVGIINMPSIRQFKNSSSPRFVDNEGVFNSKFLLTGGDLESNPAFLYSFPDDSAGTSRCGFFTPFVTVNDNGRPLDVPPAMFVATTYMRKQNSNQANLLPWTIAAGIVTGRITGIAGLEIEFNNEHLADLNQMKANPIVPKQNRGFAIETEYTAQKFTTSSLSYLHSAEVLVELESELAAMLLGFQWKFNTPEVRAEIKLRADNICKKYVAKSGLYDFFNKIDEENNTSELIDLQIGVLDTYVEISKGFGTLVNRVTILRTNSIQSGGFIKK